MAEIKLISQDKRIFTIDLDALIKSSTLTTLLAALPVGHTTIPLTFVHSNVLHIAIQWMNYHKYDVPTHDYDRCIGITDIEMCEFDAKLTENLECRTSCDLYDLCDFLDLHELHHLCSKALVKMFLARFPRVTVESVFDCLRQAVKPLPCKNPKKSAKMLPFDFKSAVILPFEKY